MEAKKAILIFVLICVPIYFCDVANASADCNLLWGDTNCEHCEGSTPKYLQVTLSDIKLYSGRCETAGCGRCDIVTTADPKNPINGTYILEWDANYPCQWSYADSCGPTSVRYRDTGYVDVASGLTINVIRGYYDDESVSISAYSKDGYMSGLASYFWAVIPADSGCAKVVSAPNILQICCCSPWMDLPPWNAGLSGTVAIRELGTNHTFGDFNDDGIVNFEDYAFLVTGPFSNQVLRRFAENWLLDTTLPAD
jgi:hypothetical protein